MAKIEDIEVGINNVVEEDDISVLAILIVILKHKKLVIGLTFVFTLLVATVCFFLPNIYRANTKLLPPQQSQSSASALLSQLGGVASVVAGGAGLKNPNELYVSMLKSRNVADSLIAEFGLTRVYDLDSQEKTRDQLAKNTSIAAGKDGVIVIEVEDSDPKRAAALANSYVNQLTRLSKTLAVTEASKRRLFFERQLETAKNNLATAEVTLKHSLDEHGVISVDADSRVIVETVGRLRGQISAKEIQLNSMGAFVTPNNVEYKRTQEELASLRSQVSKLENGRGDSPDVGIQGGKQAGLDNIRILRDLKYYQMLYELLAKQYEAARLDEAKDPAIIQVLDPAIQPERKYRPKRAIITLAGAAVAFLLSIVLAFLLEARKKMFVSAQSAAQLMELKAHLGRKR
jgi:uncharacterized protein involved in exopolysaccharide biosynthesis